MSEEITTTIAPLIAKIIMLIVGIIGFLTISSSGKNSYTFEIGDNLFLLSLTLTLVGGIHLAFYQWLKNEVGRDEKNEQTVMEKSSGSF